MTTAESREHYRFGLFGGSIPSTEDKGMSLIDITCTLILDDEVMLTDGVVNFGDEEGIIAQQLLENMFNRDPETLDCVYVAIYREKLITTLESLGYPRASLQGQVYVEWVNSAQTGEYHG